MWIDAELAFSSYKPIVLEKGMKFIKWNTKNIDGHYELYELDFIPVDADFYMTRMGCPVELSLYEWNPYNPNVNQLATSNELGWVDDSEDEMHEITIDDFNSILRANGRCQIQCVDDHPEGMVIPVYDEEKVIIRLIEEEE